MKDKIRPPIKIDSQGRAIRDPKQKPHRWRLNVPASITGTKKKRLDFHSEKAAKEHADTLLDAHRKAGDLTERLKARGMSITEALEYALSHAPLKGSKAVNLACEELVKSREAINCKPRHVGNLKSHLVPFKKAFGAEMMDAITKSQLEKYLSGLKAKDKVSPIAPKTRNNVLITLNSLFNFAVEEGWCTTNPAKKILWSELDEVPTSILSPAETQKLLQTGCQDKYRDVFPAVLIQTFAAPRRSELQHITWECIKDKYLRLDKTKVKKKRAVEMPDVLIEWLAPFRERSGRIFCPADIEFDPKDTRPLEDAYTYRLNQIAAEAGVTLPKNVLRHTGITYRDAFTETPERTARWAGTSQEVIEEHYRGAATKVDAEEFNAVRPSPDWGTPAPATTAETTAEAK